MVLAIIMVLEAGVLIIHGHQGEVLTVILTKNELLKNVKWTSSQDYRVSNSLLWIYHYLISIAIFYYLLKLNSLNDKINIIIIVITVKPH